MINKEILDETGLSEADYLEINRLRNQIFAELIKLFEQFYIFFRIQEIVPLRLLNQVESKFLYHLIFGHRDHILLRIVKLTFDSGKDCVTITKLNSIMQSKLPSDRKDRLNSQLKSLRNDYPNLKKEFLREFRDARLAHNIPDKPVSEAVQKEVFSIEDMKESLTFAFRMFEILSSHLGPDHIFSSDWKYENSCRFIIFGNNRSLKRPGPHDEISDVDEFVIDFLERHHPDIFYIPMQLLRKTMSDRSHGSSELTDDDFVKIERLKELKSHTDAVKSRRIQHSRDFADHLRNRYSNDADS